MGKGEVWFSYNPDVKEGEFDVHKIKGRGVDERGPTIIVSKCPEFHGEDTEAHRLFGWAVAMVLSKEGDVDINLNPNQQVQLPNGYNFK